MNSYFSLSFLRVNEEKLELVGEKNRSEDVAFGLWELVTGIFPLFLTSQRTINRFVVDIIVSRSP